MADNNSQVFEETITTTQFRASKGIKKIYFNKMFEKGGKNPVFYKDKDGNITSIQRVVAKDEAGNIVANVSRAVAEPFLEGKKLPDCAVGIRHYESVDANGVVSQKKGYTIYSPSNQGTEVDI